MLHMTPHQTFIFGLSCTCSMMLCGCHDPHILKFTAFACLQHQRHEKWPCWKTWCLLESWVFYRFSQACHRQKCVAMGCLLVVAPAKSAPFMHRETTAFREPYAHLFMASAFPVKPDRLTSLDLEEHHTDVLYLLVGDALLASSMPFLDTPSLQKLVVPCFYPFCVWCCFLINTTKLPLHPHNGLKLRKPHNNSRLVLSWCHLCVKWQQRPNYGLWGSLKFRQEFELL